MSDFLPVVGGIAALAAALWAGVGDLYPAGGGGTQFGVATLAGTQTFTGVNTFSNSTASTSTSTGAVVLSGGGLGVHGAINGGSTISAAGSITAAIAGNSTTNFVANATTAGTECGMTFQNAGTAWWTLFKGTSNSFTVYDNVNSTAQLTVSPGSGTSGQVNVTGTLAVGNIVAVNGGEVVVNGSNAVVSINAATSSVAQIFLGVNNTVAGKIQGTTANPFIFNDAVNNVNSFYYVPGATNGGYWVMANTTASTAVGNGALYIVGGFSAGGSANIGGALNAGGAVAFTDGLTVAYTGNNTGTIAANATTAGTECGIVFRDAGTNKWGWYKETTNTFNMYDYANSVAQLTCTAGTVSSGVIAVNLTTVSTSSTTGAFTIAGGLGVAKSINCAGITAAITGSSTTNLVANAVTAGTECGLTFQDGGSAKWTLYKETTNTFNVFDNVNGVAQISVTAGSGITGLVNIAGVLTTVGAATLGGASAPSAGAFAGNKVWGRNDGSAVVAGAIGETKTATSGSVSFTTSGTLQQVTSLALTAGTWLLLGSVCFVGNGATPTGGCTAVISNTTASSSGGVLGYSENFGAFTSTSGFCCTVPVQQLLTLSASATWYLNAEANYSAGSPQFAGCLTAIRIG